MNHAPIPAASSPSPTATPMPAASPPTTIASDVVTAAPPAVASADAKRIAGAILEVLAGARSITDAALAIGVSPARYYQLEARALAGLIAACEARPCGRPPGAGLQAEVERLRAERDRLRDEAARYQALARVAQAAFGPAAASAARPPVARGAPPADVAKRRTRRVTTARGLKLAKHLHDERAPMHPDAASTTPPPRGTSSLDQAGG